MTPLQQWLRRGSWLIIGIAVVWAAYKFGWKYTQCRGGSDHKVTCFLDAVSWLYIETWGLIVITITKILRLVLP